MSLLCLTLTILHAFFIVSNAAVIPVDNPVTLQLSRLVNEKGIRNLVALDQARAKAMIAKALGGPQPDSSPLISQAVAYIATVDVGSPSTPCTCVLHYLPLMMLNMSLDQLLVDTGRYVP